MSVKLLQRKLTKKREKISQLYTEVSAIVDSLSGICDHSLTSEYKWEHDNGYGRQTMIAGKRCSFCAWLDPWNRNHFIDPKDFCN